MEKCFSILVLFFLFSCTKGRETVLTYDKYDFNGILIKKESATQTYRYLNNTESELTIIKDSNHKKTIGIKEINDKIYWKCNNEFVCSHSLNPVDKTGSCHQWPPFLNKRIKLITSKTYIIANKKYIVYSYGENNGSDSSIITYFLNGVGFICYYYVQGKYYYFLSSFSGIDKSLLPDIKSLKTTLVNDTSFFAGYTTKVDTLSKHG